MDLYCCYIARWWLALSDAAISREQASGTVTAAKMGQMTSIPRVIASNLASKRRVHASIHHLQFPGSITNDTVLLSIYQQLPHERTENPKNVCDRTISDFY